MFWKRHAEAILNVNVDDHSRLLVPGRFHATGDTRAGQETLRATIVRRGLLEVLYADQEAPFHDHTLALGGVVARESIRV